MKTILIAVLTFIIGLCVGVGHQLTGRVEFDQKHEVTHAVPPSRTKVTAPIPAPNLTVTTDAFAEWEAAIGASKLTDTKLRAELLERVAKRDPEQAWRLLLESGVPVVLSDIELVAGLWEKNDPRAAAEFGLTLSDPLHRPGFLRQVLTHWFFSQPLELAAWLDNQPEGGADLVSHINWSNTSYRFEVSTLAELDAMLRVGPPTHLFPDLIARGFREVWKQPGQHQAATEWLRSVDDAEVRDASWARLIENVSEDDPGAAAAMLGEISDSTAQRKASSTIAARLARNDPQAALAYADTLIEPQAAAAARKSALGTWAVAEPKQALEFMRQNQEDYALEDLGPLRLVLGDNKPGEALEAVSEFPISSARSAVIRLVYNDWFRTAPTEAKGWLESHQSAILSADDLAVLRKNMQPDNSPPMSSHSSTINGRRVTYAY